MRVILGADHLRLGRMRAAGIGRVVAWPGRRALRDGDLGTDGRRRRGAGAMRQHSHAYRRGLRRRGGLRHLRAVGLRPGDGHARRIHRDAFRGSAGHVTLRAGGEVLLDGTFQEARDTRAMTYVRAGSYPKPDTAQGVSRCRHILAVYDIVARHFDIGREVRGQIDSGLILRRGRSHIALYELEGGDIGRIFYDLVGKTAFMFFRLVGAFLSHGDLLTRFPMAGGNGIVWAQCFPFRMSPPISTRGPSYPRFSRSVKLGSVIVNPLQYGLCVLPHPVTGDYPSDS